MKGRLSDVDAFENLSREDVMVADLKTLSESLRESTPENYLRKMIRARKSEIEKALANDGSFLLRVPDGRQIKISRRAKDMDAAAGIAQ
jgi:hypothetical protein